MTQSKSALLGLLEQLSSAEEGMRMRRLLGAGLQMLIDAEAEEHIGAGQHERTPTRTTQRNGTRDRPVATTAGDVTVQIPKTRTGSFFPSLLQPRRRVDRALHAVVCEAYVHGVSTVRSTIWSLRSGSNRACRSRRCRGSAPSSTPRWRPGGTGRWTTPGSPTYTSTPPM